MQQLPSARQLRSALCVGTLCLLSPWALADITVLDFDDIGLAGPLPALYGGLDWSASSWLAFGVPQEPYTAHSGDWRVTMDFGSSDAASTISFLTPSVFVGAWFSGYGDAPVTVQMYRQGSLVATSSTLTPSASPSFLSGGYAGLVDKLVFVSPNQAFYAMDDLTFDASPVPETQTWALMAAGLVFLARRMRSPF